MAQVRGDRMTLERAEHDVSGLLDEAIGMARLQAANREIEVVRHDGPPLGSGFVDRAMLIKAIGNLIANGVRFTPDGGRVEVEAWTKGGELVVVVRDNGVGIPEEKLANLFKEAVLLNEIHAQPTSTTLEFNTPGLGLGLPIARGIVEAHGGTINVESTVGRGTAFVIHVPLDMERRLSEAA